MALTYGGSIIDPNLIDKEESKNPNKINIADQLSSKEETKEVEISNMKESNLMGLVRR